MRETCDVMLENWARADSEDLRSESAYRPNMPEVKEIMNLIEHLEVVRAIFKHLGRRLVKRKSQRGAYAPHLHGHLGDRGLGPARAAADREREL